MLDDLKVGDSVAIIRKGRLSKNAVKRLTKTLIVTDQNERFRRSDGYKVGEMAARYCGFTVLEKWQDEHQKILNENNQILLQSDLIVKLRKMKVSDLDGQNYKIMLEAYEKVMKKL